MIHIVCLFCLGGVKGAEPERGRWIPEKNGVGRQGRVGWIQRWADGTYRDVVDPRPLPGCHIGRCLRHLCSGLPLSLVPARSHGMCRASASLVPHIFMWLQAFHLHVLVYSWLALDTRWILFLPMGVCNPDWGFDGEGIVREMSC